jgi:hypothetical protein
LRQRCRIELVLHRREQYRADVEKSVLAIRRHGPVIVLARGEDELQFVLRGQQRQVFPAVPFLLA